jgi:alanine racemase
MNPPRWIEVDLGVVGRNTRAVRGLLDPSTRFSAVVKADGYGHGAAAAGRTALACGADALAVAELAEALVLRRAGIKAPILVMGPVPPEDAPIAIKERLAVMMDDARLLSALSRAARAGRPAAVHVKADLGMARWGVPLGGLREFLAKVRRTKGVRLEGVFAHPGYMPGKNGPRSEAAVEEFFSVLGGTPNLEGVEIHVADSALLLNFPRFQKSRVRIGNLIYGIVPGGSPLKLENPWQAFSRLVRVRSVAQGRPVGYGGEFIASRPMTVASAPTGYAHGLTMEPAGFRAGSGSQVFWGLVRGVRCPFVGRVGMGHVLLDVSAVPDVRPGDAVRLPLRRTASAGWARVYKPISRGK